MRRRLANLVVVLAIFLCFPGLAIAVDPLEGSQWYLGRIKAQESWAITKGDSDVVVAVLDTGVDLQHPDLKNNLWRNRYETPGDGLDNDKNGYIDDVNGWNFWDDINDPQPYTEEEFVPEAVDHGTFVSGVISAIHDNNIAVKGLSAKVKIMPLVVLDEFGYGDSYLVARAINYAVDNGADIINLSFGGPDYNTSVISAIKHAEAHNVIIVVAAGNNIYGGYDFVETSIYPVCYDQDLDRDIIIGVASSNRSDRLSGFSNYGECIDITAPGEDIVGLAFVKDGEPSLSQNTIDHFDGTSFSTAMVSGTVALMRSLNPHLDALTVNEILKKTAVNISSQNSGNEGRYGAGLLNTYAAVNETLTNYSKYGYAKILLAPEKDLIATIKTLDSDLKNPTELSIFTDGYKGLNISSADLNSDFKKEYVVGAASGSMPLVRGLTADNKLVSSFVAFEESFTGGVRVAAGDVNGDGEVEYVVTPQSKRKPVVRIFNKSGQLLKEFVAYDPENLSGLSVAVGDVMGDERAEIVVGSPKGNAPVVKIFDETGKALKQYNVFPLPFSGSVNVTVANVDSFGYDEMIVSGGVGYKPQVKIFSGEGKLKSSFYAYNERFLGGVRTAVGDVDGDKNLEIITVPSAGGGPHVRIFDQLGSLVNEAFPYEKTYTGGLNVAVID